jgi:hypothetical protein
MQVDQDPLGRQGRRLIGGAGQVYNFHRNRFGMMHALLLLVLMLLLLLLLL